MKPRNKVNLLFFCFVAPLAAGIMALVLQANPQLTWRDVQHIIANTARITSKLDQGWRKNAVGIKFNHKFGFGLLDAGAMVDAALNWTNVADQHVCVIKGPMPEDSRILSQGKVLLKLNTDACKGTPDFVKKLEHVQVVLSVIHRRRGDITVDITSPQGTESQLMSRRSQDDSTRGLRNWPFMTMHLWGENPAGEWTVVVGDAHNMNDKSKVDMEAREEKMIHKQVLAQRDNIPRASKQDESTKGFDEIFTRDKTEKKMYDETLHGRFKGDYMEQLASNEIGTRDQIEGDKDEEFFLDGPVAGRVQEWALVLYGTGD